MKAGGREREKGRKTSLRPSLRAGVCVVGLGNWGTSLTRGLAGAGIVVREVVVRDAAAARRGRLKLVSWNEAALDAEMIWLCVPDGQIAKIEAQIAARRGDMRGQVVVHSSGALSLDVLSAVKSAGAAVASVHPVMSFPTRRVVRLRGVLFGIEADSAATRRGIEMVVRALGGRPFAIDAKNAESKALYHAAGTLASPLLLSAMKAAMDTARLAGLTARQAAAVVGALAGATVSNLATRGIDRSFSGPFARGDAATIDLHLRVLAQHPMLADVYRSLARQAVERLPVRRRAALRSVLADKK
jgi:predicted short-subunit dehydrogenase-like oxidoreductase (DUF2520 family)